MLATTILALTARSVAPSFGPPQPHADGAEADPTLGAMPARSCRLRRSGLLRGVAGEVDSELIGHGNAVDSALRGRTSGLAAASSPSDEGPTLACKFELDAMACSASADASTFRRLDFGVYTKNDLARAGAVLTSKQVCTWSPIGPRRAGNKAKREVVVHRPRHLDERAQIAGASPED